MYAYVIGEVKEINPRYVTIENNGIGYLIVVPNPFSYRLFEEKKIFTHHYVREDINTLYGFIDQESKDLFIRLIGVSGIGPKSALSILAADSIKDVIYAIESGDAKYLTKFPGIGMKSAQQIILDLKGKLVETDEGFLKTASSDVVDALISLGYSRQEIKKVLSKIDNDKPVEIMIKEALQLLLK